MPEQLAPNLAPDHARKPASAPQTAPITPAAGAAPARPGWGVVNQHEPQGCDQTRRVTGGFQLGQRVPHRLDHNQSQRAQGQPGRVWADRHSVASTLGIGAVAAGSPSR